MRYSTLAILLAYLMLLGCQTKIESFDIDEAMNSFLKENQLDKRTTYLNLEVKDNKLVGTATNQITVDDFILHLRQKENKYFDSEVNILQPRKAVVRNSVSNARSEAKHSAELSTQYLMGQVVSILEQDGDWFYIQGPDEYLSWIDAGGILVEEEISPLWIQSPKKRVEINEFAAKTTGGTLATDLVFGNILGMVSENTYVTPDGTELIIENPEVFQPGEKKDRIEEVMNKATSLMGRPYLWGGTSTKGMDCSGFTRIAFMNADYLLGRDASLQVKEGIKVDVNKREDWKTGDLLFFGNVREDGSHRITHVAIHLGDGEMIHASERVRIESINPESELYNETRDKSLLEVRRIF